MLESLLSAVGGKLGLAALAGGTTLLAVFGKRLIPGLVKRGLGKALEGALTPDPKDPVKSRLIRDLVFAAIKLAEYEIPDRGNGERRKAVVMAVLMRFIPEHQAKTISDLIDEGVSSLDDELKKLNEQAQNKP